MTTKQSPLSKCHPTETGIDFRWLTLDAERPHEPQQELRGDAFNILATLRKGQPRTPQDRR